MPVAGDAFRNITNAMPPGTGGRLRRLGLSPRAQRLNELWARYKTQQYDVRLADWDGSQRPTSVEREIISSQGFIPPGFYDAGGQMDSLPIKFRRPSTPYHLAKVIVDRFTGLLFTESRHPRIRCPGDSDTEDYVAGIADVTRLWARCIEARQFGGATGSACMSFMFDEGRPVIEVHDPRWTTPKFVSRTNKKLTAIEERYQYPEEVFNPKTERYEEIAFWYRRTIDIRKDVLFKPVPVGSGDEPDWDNLIEREVEHGHGFCPVIWVQNLPVKGEVDGEGDCSGIFDLCDAIDMLLSAGNQGTILNCDPTPVLSTDKEDWPVLRKGSANAVKLEKGGGFSYAEITGAGPKAALEMADKLRSLALEVAQCTLEHPDVANRTATEVERSTESMNSKGDILREQYGQHAVLPLLEMIIAAARKLGTPRAVNGEVTRSTISIPPRVIEDETGNVTVVERKLGPGAPLQLLWSGYAKPSIKDASDAATAASTAKAAGLIDSESASQYVAPYFNVENPRAMIAKAKEEAASEQEAVQSSLMQANRSG